jgi:hypothetical protein
MKTDVFSSYLSSRTGQDHYNQLTKANWKKFINFERNSKLNRISILIIHRYIGKDHGWEKS